MSQKRFHLGHTWGLTYLHGTKTFLSQLNLAYFLSDLQWATNSFTGSKFLMGTKLFLHGLFSILEFVQTFFFVTH